VDWYLKGWNTPAEGAIASGAEMIAIVPLVAICAYMILATLKKDKQ
jgi:hypothetical protein